MEEKNKLVNNIENLTVFLVGFSFLIFPVVFTTINTDIFSIPKQTVFGVVAIASFILFGVKVALSGSLRIRRTPFDLPLILFTLAVFLSSLFSLNRSESLVSFVPLLFSVIIFFAIVNSVNKDRHFLFLSASLVAGSAIVSIISVLNVLKVYLLPFPFARASTFTPFGNPLDQAIFLGVIVSFCIYFLLPYIKEKKFPRKEIIFLIGGAVAGLGLLASLYVLIVLQRPNILPLSTGFQTAFAAISQDTGRILQGFLFGSGYGTYLSDFTRFKPATFNLNADIWNLSFIRSSSFALELLATTGVLGFLSFLLLAYKALRIKPLFFPLIAIIVLSFILPFSYLTIAIIFIILGVFSISPFVSNDNKANFYDEEIKLMSFRKGILGIASSSERNVNPSIIPYVFLALALLIGGLLGYFSAKFLYSDILFQRSLVAASQNDGAKTYDLQTKAISTFPYRDGYHRIFSQINLALANNLAASVPKGSSPSAQVQQNIYTLIQQAINSGRASTSLSPLTSVNWVNLSSIYRSLIGFGQNADQFSILASQQAIALDPNNPQQYITYGGIFYQMQQWDNAINQFQIAVQLKPDFANAYYNLGHALEEKGDLQNALNTYQTVKNLLRGDKENLEQISKEIDVLQKKIGSAQENQGEQTEAQAENQPDLGISSPSASLPPQKPPVKIPAPQVTPSPTRTPTPSPTKTPSPTL